MKAISSAFVGTRSVVVPASLRAAAALYWMHELSVSGRNAGERDDGEIGLQIELQQRHSQEKKIDPNIS